MEHIVLRRQQPDNLKERLQRLNAALTE